MKIRRLAAIVFGTSALIILIRRLTVQTPPKRELRTNVEEGLQGDALDILPVKLGAKRVAFQLNSLLPQVHLTLISVLQGVALGVLIAQFDSTSPFSFPEILLYADSLVIIALIWHLYAVAFITFLWPFSFTYTLLHFFLTLVESYALASISEPAKWALGFAGVAFIGTLIRLLNAKVVSPVNYEREDIFVLYAKAERTAAKNLVFTCLVFLALGVVMLIAGWQQYRYLRHLTAVAGAVVGLALLWLIWRDEGTAVIQKHLEGSRWVFKRKQIVVRESEYTR